MTYEEMIEKNIKNKEKKASSFSIERVYNKGTTCEMSSLKYAIPNIIISDEHLLSGIENGIMHISNPSKLKKFSKFKT